MCPQKRTRWIFCKKDIGIRGGFKRNRSVLDLEINEEEATVVRLIFQKYVNEGMGSLRISRYLHGTAHRAVPI